MSGSARQLENPGGRPGNGIGVGLGGPGRARRGSSLKSFVAGILAALTAIGILLGGGPLILESPGNPHRWGGNPPRLVFHPDTGSLGSLDASTAMANFLAAAEAWEAIESSSIELRSGGSIQSISGPEGGGDFAVSNIAAFLGVNNGGITPIVFDSEDSNGNGVGDIFDALGLGPGVLGIAAPEFVDGNTIIEGFLLLNGLEVDPDDLTGENFRGIMTHELGHLLNFAHSVVNGQALFFGGSDALTPDGQPLNPGLNDLETMYPFSRPDVGGTGIGQSSPHLDDIAIASTMYPNSAHPLENFGSIQGIVTNLVGQRRTGAQIIARNHDGDPFQDAVSAISGDFLQGFDPTSPFNGHFQLNRLTPGGRYSLELRDTLAGGFSTPVFVSPDAFVNSMLGTLLGTLPGPEEYFSGPAESHDHQIDDPNAAPFLIEVGGLGPAGAPQADFFLNGFVPPPNDACSAARAIPDGSLPFEDRLQTRGATTEIGEPSTSCGSGIESESVWYSLTSATDREILLSTSASEYPTVIQVYTGQCGLFQPLQTACGNGVPVRLQAQAGTPYLIKVADFGTQRGGGILNFTASIAPPAPAHDMCTQAIAVDLADLPFTDVLDTANATITAGEPAFSCSFTGPGFNSVWYTFTNQGPAARILDLSTIGSNFDTVVEAFTGGCGNLQPVSCDDDGGPNFSSVASLTAQPGQTYHVKVGGFSGSGNLNFSINPGPVAPAHDECSSAVEIRRRDLPFSHSLDTRAATNAVAEPVTTCGFSSVPTQSASIWYRLTNDSILPLDLRISTAGSNFSAVLQSYTGGCGAFAADACATLNGPLLASELNLSLKPGEERFLKVAGLGGLGGGHLNLTVEPMTPSGLIVSDLLLGGFSSPNQATARGRLDFTLSVHNISDAPAQQVTLTATADPALELREAHPTQGDCEILEGGLHCALGSIQPGQEPVISIATSPRDAGGRSLTATLDWASNVEAAGAQPSLTLLSTVAPFLIFPSSLDPESAAANTFVGIALVNPGSEENQFGLEGTHSEGFSTFVADDFGLLEAGGQSAFTAGEIPGLGEDTSTIIARGNEFPLRGFFMAGNLNLRRLDGIGGAILPATSLLYPVIPASSEAASRLKLFNPSLQDARGTLRLLDAAGQLVAEVELNLSGGGSAEGNLSNFLALPEYDAGYVTVESDLPLQGWVWLLHADHVSSQLAQEIGLARSMWSPHYFIDGNGGDSILTLVSLDHSIVDIALELFDDQGLPLAAADLQLAPGEQIQHSLRSLFSITPAPGATVTGHLSLLLTPHGSLDFFSPRSRVSGTISYTANQGRVRSMLPLLRAARTASSFYQIAQSVETGLFTGLAILSSQNPNFNIDTLVTVRAFNRDGEMTAEKQLTLGAGNRVLGLLDEDIYFGPGFVQNGGRLEVISDRSVYAFALFGDFAAEFLSAIEGQGSLGN